MRIMVGGKTFEVTAKIVLVGKVTEECFLHDLPMEWTNDPDPVA